MKIKVCGITQEDQFHALDQLETIDYIGMIFYSKSPRFTNNPTPVIQTPKVGVFVDASAEEIELQCSTHTINTVQLHGNETPEFCQQLQEKFKVIKAVGIDEQFDFKKLTSYEGSVDYFLFDTKTINHGGSGKKFQWEQLKNYHGTTPFFLSGGIRQKDLKDIKSLHLPLLSGIDVNSGFEVKPGVKNLAQVKQFSQQLKQSYVRPDEAGFYGEFGGSFIPELLYQPVLELKEAFNKYRYDNDFQKEFKSLLRDYVGRPSPLFYSPALSKKYGGKIYLKREDLNHTGSHKINNAIGQILLAKRMGKTKIIAETGAGQHGVACATACALLKMECIVFMGEKDMERQAHNVQRMRYLGASVVPATSGSKTLKDATNEAIRYWINNVDAYYLIGSVVGPHPYPELVAEFQSIISEEIKTQLFEKEHTFFPSKVIACVGGGSNAAGAFYHFYDQPSVELIAVEAAGLGLESGASAATSILGKPGVIHGSLTYLMQDEYGQITEPHSISAGLDYPGIGPLHASTISTGRTKAVPVTDAEAIVAARFLTQHEGIIPALESAHAIAALEHIKIEQNEVVVINLSGRGDKDLTTYFNYEQDESI